MSRNRLTSLDASFLTVESATAHMHVGWAAVLAPPAEGRRPGFEELRRHVGGRLARAPRYRQRLVEAPLGLGGQAWVDDPDFDLSLHVRRSDATDIGALADQVMSVQLVRERPLWELWIADRLADGSIGIVGKVHHCMVDGVAAVELGALVLDPSPDADPAETSDRWSPAALPGPARLVAEAALDGAGKAAALARAPLALARRPERLAGLLGSGARALRAARHSFSPAPPSLLNGPISGRRHLAGSRRPLDHLREIKREHDSTVNDVLLAAAAGGIRSYLQRRGERPERLKAMVPVSVREKGAEGELGNRISFVFVELPCDEPDPVRRLHLVKAAMDDRKTGGEPEGAGSLLGAADLAPRVVQAALSRLVASPRTFNLVVSNIPGPPLPLYMLGCRLREVYPVVPIADRHAVAVGMTTVEDQAFFGIYADPDSLGDADELASAIADAVDELRTLERVRISGNGVKAGV